VVFHVFDNLVATLRVASESDGYVNLPYRKNLFLAPLIRSVAFRRGDR